MQARIWPVFRRAGAGSSGAPWWRRPLLAHAVLAVALGAAAVVVFRTAPMLFARLVTEDEFGEFATALVFGCAALLLFAAAWRSEVRACRISWALIGVIALFIAGEEVSWGERVLRALFGVESPVSIRELNVQNEFNVHNLESVGLSERIYGLLAPLLLGCVALSAALEMLRPGWMNRLLEVGVPLVPLHLCALFLLAPVFLLLRPVGMSAEVEELFMGIAGLAWAIDRYRHSTKPQPGTSEGSFGVLATALLLVSVGAAALAAATGPERLFRKLNSLAAQEYPRLALYSQSERIFEYLDAQPERRQPTTRLDHANLLMRRGLEAQATRIVQEVIRELEGRDANDQAKAFELRLLATAQLQLGRANAASRVLDRALAIDRARLKEASTVDEKAHRLWSIAQSLELAGQRQAAQRSARQALALDPSAAVGRRIELWLAGLE